jgi:hypothetical protein
MESKTPNCSCEPPKYSNSTEVSTSTTFYGAYAYPIYTPKNGMMINSAAVSSFEKLVTVVNRVFEFEPVFILKV